MRHMQEIHTIEESTHNVAAEGCITKNIQMKKSHTKTEVGHRPKNWGGTDHNLQLAARHRGSAEVWKTSFGRDWLLKHRDERSERQTRANLSELQLQGDRRGDSTKRNA